MDSSVIEGRSLALRVANRSIYPLWALLLAGLAMLAVAVVLFLPALSEASDVEASVLAAAGFACVGFAGLRIAYLKFSALYTVTPDAITARYGLIARKSHQIQVACELQRYSQRLKENTRCSTSLSANNYTN